MTINGVDKIKGAGPPPPLKFKNSKASEPVVLTFEVGAPVELDPLAYAFPSQSADEYRALIIGIRHHGQLTPVTSWRNDDGSYSVANGRHRVRACQYLGLPIKHEPFKGTREELIALVEAENSGRMLSVGQRAIRAIRSKEYIDLRRLSDEKKSGNLPKVIGRSLSGEKVSAKHSIARIKGCSVASITKAVKVDRYDKSLGDKVLSGAISLESAVKEIPKKVEPDEPKEPKPYSASRAYSDLDKLMSKIYDLPEADQILIGHRLKELGNDIAAND